MVNPRFVIKAVLSGQRLNINVPLTVAGTVNYVGVEAKCTSEWDDCTVVCYLYQTGTGYTAQLGLIYDAERKLYYYPNAERLTLTAGEWAVWFVGVMAESGQETYKVTSETRYFTVYEYPFASSIPPGDISLDEEAIARATDAQNKANLLLDKYNAGELTGPKGDPGDPAEIGFVQASVDNTTGNPGCLVTVTENPENTYNMQFAFSGIKGAKGDTGATGPKGDTGAQGAPGRDGTDGRDGVDGETIDDYVLVQAEQPTSETNKMWLKPTTSASPVMIPSVEEFQAVETDITNLQNAIETYTGNREISFIKGYYIPSQNSPVDPTNLVADPTFKCAAIDCAEGDSFTLTIKAAVAARTWCFIDSNNAIIQVAGSRRQETNTVLTAPKNAAKLILNDLTDGVAYYGEFVGTETRRISDSTKKYVEALNDEDNLVTLPIYTGNVPGLTIPAVISVQPNLVYIDGTVNQNALRVSLANIIDSYTSNPTPTNKPKWFNTIADFVQGHKYAYNVKLLSGTYTLENGQNPIYMAFKHDGNIIAENASGTFLANTDINSVFFHLRRGTYSECWLYFEIIDITANTDNQYINFNFNRLYPMFDHLFVNNEGIQITVPAESLEHIRLSPKLGFNVIELHPQMTSDGYYIVNHLINGTFARYFHHVDGTTDISGITVASVTYSWIVENVRYNSTIAKYQTAPPTLEEALRECRVQGLIPLVYIGSADVYNTCASIMGEQNFIAYNASRDMCPNGVIMHWKNDLTDYNAILNYCKSVGKPFIYGLGNIDSFTSAQRKELSNLLHQNGFYLQYSYADNNNWLIHEDGLDFNATNRSCNRINSGNLCNLSALINFNDFQYTNANVVDGCLTYTGAGTLSPDIASTSYPACCIDIEIVYKGTITLNAIGEQFSNLQKTSADFSRVVFTNVIINGSPKFTISANARTVIKDISFKASIC